MGYSAFVLLPKHEADLLERFHRAVLGKKGLAAAHMKLNAAANALSIDFGGYRFQVTHASGKHVAAEAREILADGPEGVRPSADEPFSDRLEVWSDAADPGMDHFNDFIFLCEAAEIFPGAVLFDSASGEFI